CRSHRDDTAGGRRTRGPLQDQGGGVGVVVHAHIAAAEGSAPLRVPDVLVEGQSAPRLRELDLGAGAEHAVGDPAQTHASVGVVHLVEAVVGAEAGGAYRVADVEADGIAALQVEL